MVSNNNGVGASVAIYGMISAYIGHMFMNWNYLDRTVGNAKWVSLFFIIFIVFINLLLGFNNPVIDNYGHIGGLICGFFLIFIMLKPNEENDGICCGNDIWFYISIGVTVFLFVGGLIIFYMVRVIPEQVSKI